MDLQTWLRKDIPVDPAVRLTRLVRSRSGRFEDAYELREKDVLGTGMTGGVIVGKNKHWCASDAFGRVGWWWWFLVEPKRWPGPECVKNEMFDNKKSSFISKNGLNTVCHSWVGHIA